MTISSTDTAQVRRFQRLLETRGLRVGVVGLGYAGLPLALGFAEAGFEVVGVDVDAERIDAVNSGRSYLVDVPTDRYLGLEGSLRATSDYDEVADLDAIVICVPTPLTQTRAPDVSRIAASVTEIGERLRSGQVIVLQSTTYPGTTAEVVLPLLEAHGMQAGVDFHLGYSPERVDPGNRDFGVQNTPRVVSGVTDLCRQLVAELYMTIVDEVVPVTSTTVAELAKLHENTFRAVNIALANELALMCRTLGVSSWEVIDAAATKPFAFLPHYPGPGIGGDCIPVVSHFLVWRLQALNVGSKLIAAAHEVNDGMANHVLGRVLAILGTVGVPTTLARVLILGVSYKPDVPDTRNSPAIPIILSLRELGADVRICDPLVPHFPIGDETVLASEAWDDESVGWAHCVVVVTAHSLFVEQPRWQAATSILDTRNVVPPADNVHGL